MEKIKSSKKSMDLVTVIVPVYNVEKYLRRCLDSIINQTYKNIEIILIDDGSTDSSGKICNDYFLKDSRIIVEHIRNGGVSNARNVGIRMAKGEYIIFIDTDDYIKCNYIERLYKKIIEYNSDIVISNAIDFTDAGVKKTKKKINKDICFNKEKILKELFREKYFTSTCWGNIYKTNLVKQVMFSRKMKIAEDLKFLFDIFKISSKVTVIPDRLYYYYINDNSTIHSGFNKKWEDEFNYCKNLIKTTNEKSIKKYIIKRFVRVNISCAKNFNLSSNEYILIKNNIRPYIKDIIFCNIYSIKFKINAIFVYYFYSIIKN